LQCVFCCVITYSDVTSREQPSHAWRPDRDNFDQNYVVLCVEFNILLFDADPKTQKFHLGCLIFFTMILIQALIFISIVTYLSGLSLFFIPIAMPLFLLQCRCFYCNAVVLRSNGKCLACVVAHHWTWNWCFESCGFLQRAKRRPTVGRTDR